MSSADLDQFVLECDRLGGPQHPDARDYLSDFNLQITTAVDQSLDPFSENYVAQQIAVYREIANRELHQETGEQMDVPITRNVFMANPYGSEHVHFISKHSRAVLTTLLVANVPPKARILDLGCGWGLSSEVMAFCGTTVDAVDINPQFIALVKARAERQQLPINTYLSEFDNLDTGHTYDLALFYECLHHAVRPWETLAQIVPMLNENGKIAIAGEPINSEWWRNWGIRLDSLSVYCIRKFGWFESGFSGEFLLKCFARAGLDLTLYDEIGLDNGFIGIAVKQGGAENSEFARPRPDFASNNVPIANTRFKSPMSAPNVANLLHFLHEAPPQKRPPPLASLTLEYARFMARIGFLRRAEAAYRRYLKLNVRDPRAWKQLGHKLKDQGLRREAFMAYTASHELDGSDEDTLFHLNRTRQNLR